MTDSHAEVRRDAEPCPHCGCPGSEYDGHACEDYATDEHLVRSALLYLFENDIPDEIDARVAEAAFSRILAGLEQAERERGEAAVLMLEKARVLEARLAKVPALVEALRDIATTSEHTSESVIARAALTVYEQSQGNG